MMRKGNNLIGKLQKSHEPDVVISGVGIHPIHCTLDYSGEDNRTTILPNSEDPKRFPTHVNGELLELPQLLQHGDRILIGLHHCYLFVDP